MRLAALGKRGLHHPEKLALIADLRRRRLRFQTHNRRHHLWRRHKAAGRYVEQYVRLCVVIYKHRERAVSLRSRQRRHPLRDLPLHHYGHAFKNTALKQSCYHGGRYVVGQVCAHHKTRILRFPPHQLRDIELERIAAHNFVIRIIRKRLRKYRRQRPVKLNRRHISGSFTQMPCQRADSRPYLQRVHIGKNSGRGGYFFRDIRIGEEILPHGLRKMKSVARQDFTNPPVTPVHHSASAGARLCFFS